MRKSVSLILIIYTSLANAQEDIPIGEWRSHLSFNETIDLAIGGNRIYAATVNAVYYFDKSDNSINKITSLNGLNDISISSIGHHPVMDFFSIGYENGNLDFLINNEITNFDIIRESPIISSKTINHFLFQDNLVYISTNFGVVVFDVENVEIMESYLNLGEKGNVLAVHESTLFKDSLFLATAEGVIAGDINENLLDFNNWVRYGLASGIPQNAISAITANEDAVFSAISNDAIYMHSNNGWSALSILTGTTINKITATTNTLIVTTDSLVYEADQSFQLTIVSSAIVKSPRKSERDNQDTWIADSKTGLVQETGVNSINILPSGPISDDNFDIEFVDGKIIVAAGSYSGSLMPELNPSGFYVYEHNQWENYNNLNLTGSNGIPNLLDIVSISGSGSENIFMGTFGFGLLQWNGNENFMVYDRTNSPLTNTGTGNSVYITSVKDDQSGLWVANYGVDNPLHYFQNDGVWQSFSFPFSSSRYPLQIKITQLGHLWITLDPAFGGGILLFDPLSGNSRLITTGDGLPSNSINDVEIDLEDQAWIGTEDGVAYFPNASFTINDDFAQAILPLFENRPLFRNESVDAIEVDGGNRKWIATDQGVWLFSENGDQLIHNFNTENSPLLSNSINDMAINETE